MGRLSGDLIEKLKHAENLYHRLVLVVGPEGQGKTACPQHVAHEGHPRSVPSVAEPVSRVF